MLFAGKRSQKFKKTQAFSWFGSDRLHVSVTGLLHDCFFSSWIASRSYKIYGKRLHLDVTGRCPRFPQGSGRQNLQKSIGFLTCLSDRLHVDVTIFCIVLVFDGM